MAHSLAVSKYLQNLSDFFPCRKIVSQHSGNNFEFIALHFTACQFEYSELNISQCSVIVPVVHMNSWIWYYICSHVKQPEGFASVRLWNQFQISPGTSSVLAWILIFWETVSLGHLGEELLLVLRAPFARLGLKGFSRILKPDSGCML